MPIVVRTATAAHASSTTATKPLDPVARAELHRDAAQAPGEREQPGGKSRAEHDAGAARVHLGVSRGGRLERRARLADVPARDEARDLAQGRARAQRVCTSAGSSASAAEEARLAVSGVPMTKIASMGAKTPHTTNRPW